MTVKKKWLTFAGIIITGVLGFFTVKAVVNKQKVKQHTKVGDNSNAGRDLNQAGGDINKAEKGGTISTNKEGDVISYDQKGGITARTVIIYNAVQVSVDPGQPPVEKSKNYKCWIDTANRTIYFQPNSGSWTNPFAGIPRGEYEKVLPRLINEASDVKQKSSTEFQVGTDNLYGRQAVGSPATEKFYYGLTYKELPSYLIFGGYPNVLYKVDLTALMKKG